MFYKHMALLYNNLSFKLTLPFTIMPKPKPALPIMMKIILLSVTFLSLSFFTYTNVLAQEEPTPETTPTEEELLETESLETDPTMDPSTQTPDLTEETYQTNQSQENFKSLPNNCPKTTQNCTVCKAEDLYCREGYLGWACQNNNPGNIRYSSGRIDLIEQNGGKAPCGSNGGFMTFTNYDDGIKALKAYLKAINNGQHSAYPNCGNCTLKYFFSKYAPVGDNNDPDAYAKAVANDMGDNITISTKLEWIVGHSRLTDLAKAIKKHEGWFTSPETAKVQRARQEVQNKLLKNRTANIFMVKFKESTSYSRIRNINQGFNFNDLPDPANVPAWQKSNGYLQTISLDNEDYIEDDMLNYNLLDEVEYVEVPQIGQYHAWVDSGTQTHPQDYDQVGDDHWYYNKTKLPEVWDDQNCATGGTNCGGSDGVLIAVLDSGVAFENYSSDYEYYGSNYTTNFAVASEMNGITLWTNPDGDPSGGGDEDANGVCDDTHGVDFSMWNENQADAGTCAATTDIQKEGHPNDDYGHGTFVAGVIASLTDNASSDTVGSAHNVEIMPMKISAPFAGPNSLALYNSVVYAVDYGADIITISSGWTYSNDDLKDAINHAYENGVIVTASSGNGYGNGIDYPAYYTKAFAVGATRNNAYNQRATYSDWGSKLDISAPVGQGSSSGYAAYQQTLACATGAGTCTSGSDFTAFDKDYWIGTSFAAPQAAAAAALVKTRNTSATRSDMEFVLANTATDVTYHGTGWDERTGYGIINLEDIWNAEYFESNQTWKTSFGQSGDIFRIGDVDGDSRDDIIKFRKNYDYRTIIALSNGSNGFESNQTWKSKFGESGDVFNVGDFDNDGETDIIKFRHDYKYRAVVAISNGSSAFGGNQTWKSKFGKSGDKFLIGDVDGDGDSDIIKLRHEYSYRAVVAKSNNIDSFGSNETWKSSFGESGDIFMMGDVDGDTNDDLVKLRKNDGYKAVVALSNGTNGFESNQTWKVSSGSSGDSFRLADVNGDGNADLVRLRKEDGDYTKVIVSLSNGSSFGSNQTRKFDIGESGDAFRIGDFNNDTYYDIVKFRKADSYKPVCSLSFIPN